MSTTLRVGELYVPSRTRWQEGVEYNLYAGGHELRLFFDRPTSTEVRAIRKGTVRFGLFVSGPILWLLFRFGDEAWCDAPYSWWMVPDAIRVAPDPVAGMTPNTRAGIQVVMVDASTGILRALRWVTVSPEFTRMLHLAIEAQIAAGSITRSMYDAAINSVNRRYTTDQMVVYSVTQCVGGE